MYRDGEQLEQQEQQVGIRTLELDQSPDTDEPGTRFFRFVLNGVPIFARGAAWIPAHSFVGAITTERYEMLLKDAQDAHMNMLRVWGGGIYEHDVFYELCDRLGLLIWQDFMFACAELQRVPAQPEITITQYGEHELQVHLHAVGYTYFLHLSVPDEHTHFTDNFFDLEAGESRTISVTNPVTTLTPEMVSVSWR